MIMVGEHKRVVREGKLKGQFNTLRERGGSPHPHSKLDPTFKVFYPLESLHTSLGGGISMSDVLVSVCANGRLYLSIVVLECILSRT